MLFRIGRESPLEPKSVASESTERGWQVATAYDRYDVRPHEPGQWFRSELILEDDPERDWKLYLPNASAQHIQLFVLRDGELLYQERVGSAVPFAARKFPSLRLAFNLPDELSGRVQLLFHKESASIPTGFLVHLASSTELSAHDRDLRIFVAMLFGLILGLALYNVFIFFSAREVAYVLYAGFMLSIAFFSVSAFGLAYAEVL